SRPLPRPSNAIQASPLLSARNQSDSLIQKGGALIMKMCVPACDASCLFAPLSRLGKGADGAIQQIAANHTRIRKPPQGPTDDSAKAPPSLALLRFIVDIEPGKRSIRLIFPLQLPALLIQPLRRQKA